VSRSGAGGAKGGQETGSRRWILTLWNLLQLLLKRLRAAARGKEERGAKPELPPVHHPGEPAGKGKSPELGPQQPALLPRGDLEEGKAEQQWRSLQQLLSHKAHPCRNSFKQHSN
jgi:hypothetical protein